MLKAHQIEELINVVAALNKATLIEQFHAYRANFPLDFTNEFLEAQSLERLRHLFVALCLHTQRLPETPASAA